MSQECQQPQAHPARCGCEEKKSYPDRLCHADYTAHPYRCGCLKGDAEAQRRFDEHQHHAPVPPAGGEVEIAARTMDGRELVDRAHVTRLQAELAQMTTFRDNAANHMRRIRGECTAAEKERDALKAEVERLRAERSDLRASNHSYRLQVDTIVGQRDEAENQLLRKTDAYQVKRAELTEERAKNDKLQDELTKARELIGEVCDSIANCDHYRKVCTYLAHQSAPAACWTPANHECPGDGVGACKKCPDAPAAKGERYECIGKGGRLSVCSHRAG